MNNDFEGFFDLEPDKPKKEEGLEKSEKSKRLRPSNTKKSHNRIPKTRKSRTRRSR